MQNLDLNLPIDEQLEKEILGPCFCEDMAVLSDVRAILAPEDFASETNRRIFRSLCRLADAGRPLTYTEVKSEMATHNEQASLSDLIDLGGFAWALPKALERQKDLARRRELIHRVYQLTHDAADLSLPLEDLVTRAGDALRRVYDGNGPQGAESISDIVEEAGGVGAFMKPIRGIVTPWPELNHCTGGWQSGELSLVGARPSMGKTALALNILYDAAKKGKAAVFYSYEMSRESIIKRLISMRTGITYTELQNGELNVSERRAVGEALGQLSLLPLRIVQASGKTVLAIRCHAERLRRRGLMEIAALDYIGMVRSNSTANRTHELGAICRELKQTAAELRFPFVVLAQLNRASENRTDKRPTMADLRDSGELEEHADLIMLLHRPGYYNREDPALRMSAELIITKQRNGDTPIIPLIFRRESGRFGSAMESEAAA